MTQDREITDLGIRALAAFVAEHRQDWDSAGVAATLRAERDSGDAWQLAQRMIGRASDAANTSPRLQAFDRPVFVACPKHPGAAIRTDGTCAVCFVDKLGVDHLPPRFDRRPVTAEARELRIAFSRRELHPEAS